MNELIDTIRHLSDEKAALIAERDSWRATARTLATERTLVAQEAERVRVEAEQERERLRRDMRGCHAEQERDRLRIEVTRLQTAHDAVVADRDAALARVVELNLLVVTASEQADVALAEAKAAIAEANAAEALLAQVAVVLRELAGPTHTNTCVAFALRQGQPCECQFTERVARYHAAMTVLDQRDG